MSRIVRRACHKVRAIAILFRGTALPMVKRIVLGLVAIAIAAIAMVFALQFYRHLAGESEPGIIFERSDRPSRA
ncbi:hypothetical protein [Afipia felis]